MLALFLFFVNLLLLGVNSTPATPVLRDKPSSLLEIAKAGGFYCGPQSFCPIAGGVCCPGGNYCCAGKCITSTNPPTCEPKATTIPNDAIATKLIASEQAAKDKSEQQRKLREAKKEATAKQEHGVKEQELKRKGTSLEKIDKSTEYLLVNKNAEPVLSYRLQKNADLPKCSAMTYMFWVFVKSLTPEVTELFQRGNDQEFTSPAFYLLAKSSQLSITSSVTGKADWKIEPTDALPLKRWVHVVFQHDSKHARVLFDKKVVAKAKSSGMPTCQGDFFFSLANPSSAVIADLKYMPSWAAESKITEAFEQRKYSPVDSQLKQLQSLAGGAMFTPKHNYTLVDSLPKIVDGYTYAFWIRVMGKDQHWTNILHHGTDNEKRSPSIFMKPAETRLSFRSSNSVGWNDGVEPEPELPIGTWVHVAFTHGLGRIQVLYNGKVVAEKSAGDPTDVSGPLFVGNPWFYPTPAFIADLRYAPNVLSQEQLADIYKQKLYNPAAVVPVSTMILSAAIQPSTDFVIKQAIEFPPSRGWTFAFWLRIEGTVDKWTNIFQKGNDILARNPAVFLYPSSTRLHFRSGTSKEWNSGSDPVEHLELDKWTHVAFTHSLGRWEVWYDGESKLKEVVSAPKWRNDSSVHVSNRFHDPAKVRIRDFRYYAVPLQTTDVQNIMKQQL